MKSKIPLIVRVLLGLVFFVFGLNGFLNFIPMPPPAGRAGDFMGGLGASGYFWPLLAVTETLCGAALLAGRFVPLALVVLAPIVVNIVLFHVVLAPEGLPMAIIVLACEAYLAWAYRDSFRGVLNGASRPYAGDGASTAP
jgi:uncharacterized membrane protein YphA (DoxX/SURF4 family)